MAVPKVNTCCGCASLKTGVIIIGTLTVIFSVVLIIAVYAANLDPKVFPYGRIRPSTARIILTVACAITILLAGLLLLGALTDNPMVMLPWIALTVVGIVNNIITALINVITLLVHGIIGPAIGSFVGACIGTAISIYLWLVVYTYYRELQYEKRNRTPQVYRQP